MYSVPMKSIHNFEKKNLITQKDRKGHYDLMFCTNCGIEGKRRGFVDVEVNKSFSEGKVKNCIYKNRIVTKIKITDTNLKQFGFEKFEIHETVSCPKEYENKFKKDVWVFSESRNEPVRLLTDEYEVIESIEPNE